jgi:hypothetical protein
MTAKKLHPKYRAYLPGTFPAPALNSRLRQGAKVPEIDRGHVCKTSALIKDPQLFLIEGP